MKCMCFVIIVGTGAISEGGARAGHSKTGGVARLEQADDGVTT